MRDRENTVIPHGFVVKHYRAKVAQGAYKPRIAPRGDAPTIGHAARSTAQIADTANRKYTRAWAAKGW